VYRKALLLLLGLLLLLLLLLGRWPAQAKAGSDA
jgi:hypothetical protein